MNDSDDANDRRIEFYKEVLERSSDGPDVDIPRIMTAWLKPTQASWAWLWLKNAVGNANQWEYSGGASISSPLVKPPSLTIPEDNSFLDYAIDSNSIKIGLTTDHAFTIGEKTYRPRLGPFLAKNEARLFDVVPIRSSETSKLGLDLVGAICLHYQDQAQRALQPIEGLHRLALWTALAIVQSYTQKQLRLLLKLNALQSHHLSRFGNPKRVLAEYVQELIELIQGELRVNAVSIFYGRRLSRSLACLGTTGLWHCRREEKIPGNHENLQDVASYPINDESWTARVVISGNPFARPSNTTDSTHRAVMVEMPHSKPLRRYSVLMMPIPIGDEDEKLAIRTRARGVIRSSGHTQPDSDADRNFNSLEAQALEFIAYQIAPVLASFSVRLEREDAIANLKHDLRTPITNIANRLRRAKVVASSSSETTEYRIRHYDMMNMLAAQHFAMNLINQLDADPYLPQDFHPQKTFLEGDIIAGLCNLMRDFACDQKGMKIDYGNFRGVADQGVSIVLPARLKDQMGPIKPVPPMNLDRVLIERIFTNLLTNAVKYGQADTEIRIDPHVTDDGVSIYVSNFGIGIDEEDGEAIFEPYFRSDRAKEVSMGAGLGLGIARHAMEQHGGTLRLVKSNDPTIFEVFFPRDLYHKD